MKEKMIGIAKRDIKRYEGRIRLIKAVLKEIIKGGKKT